MKNLKNITTGFLALSFLMGLFIAAPVQADDNSKVNSLFNARASLKADSLIRLEDSVGVVLGSNNTLRVLGAVVTSVSGSEINAKASIGNSSLSFVVKTDANTKFNAKSTTNTSFVSQLKAGDKISFAGTITSSTNSSIVVDGDRVISHTYFEADGKINNKNSFKGEVTAVDATNNSLTVMLKDRVQIPVKVLVSSGTIVTVDGEIKKISSIETGDEIKIAGEINSSGTVITATKVVAESDDNDDDEERNNQGKKGGNGFWKKISNFFRK